MCKTYNTVQNANDIIAVADALGYEQINFYGISYGSQYDPDGIQGVIVHLFADPRDASLANTLQLVKFPQSDIETVAEVMIPAELSATRQETTVGSRTWTVFEVDTGVIALTPPLPGARIFSPETHLP